MGALQALEAVVAALGPGDRRASAQARRPHPRGSRRGHAGQVRAHPSRCSSLSSTAWPASAKATTIAGLSAQACSSSPAARTSP
eukprot:12416475-Alexandrium_andersonii.AAC.1